MTLRISDGASVGRLFGGFLGEKAERCGSLGSKQGGYLFNKLSVDGWDLSRCAAHAGVDFQSVGAEGKHDVSVPSFQSFAGLVIFKKKHLVPLD